MTPHPAHALYNLRHTHLVLRHTDKHAVAARARNTGSAQPAPKGSQGLAGRGGAGPGGVGPWRLGTCAGRGMRRGRERGACAEGGSAEAGKDEMERQGVREAFFPLCGPGAGRTPTSPSGLSPGLPLTVGPASCQTRRDFLLTEAPGPDEKAERRGVWCAT